jgi:hypothetical protein
MVRGLLSLTMLLLAGCGAAPNEFPESARATFAKSCPVGEPKCDCAWDKITRSMTHPEYEAAMERFAREGLMDPRLTAARTECLDAK